MASWNRWIDSQEGGGLPLREYLWPGLKATPLTMPTIPAQMSSRRLANERHCSTACACGVQKPERQAERVQDWKRSVEVLLRELYSFQDSLSSISQSYFDGHEVLFPTPFRDLAELVKETEAMVEDFNKELETTEQQGAIDLQALRVGAEDETAQAIDSLVTMAKTKALDDVGEYHAVVKLVERLLLKTYVAR